MRRRFFTFLVIFLLAAPTLVIAQAPLRDNAYVRIYDHDDPANPTAYTMVFTSTAERSLSKTPVETTSTITFSPDGTWRGETFYSAEDGTPTLSYGKVGDPVQNTIEAPANTSLLFSEFTPDNRLMAYSVIDWTAQGWQLFIIELATGNTVIFAGAITFSETNGLVGGVAPLGWGADSKTLYLVGVSLDGLATPPFAVDLGNLNFAVDGTNGLPEPKPLLSPEQLGFPFYFVFSPDHTKLAYVYADTTHPVDGYMGRGEPINTIGIVDLATGAARKVVEAPTDHTVENVVWSVDGGAVLYTASSWRADRAGQPFNPQLYAHVLATETSTSPIDFTANDEAYVGFLMPCEKTLYFAVTDPPTIEGSTGITTLYSAPLSNPTEWSAPLLSGYILISRVACVGN